MTALVLAASGDLQPLLDEEAQRSRRRQPGGDLRRDDSAPSSGGCVIAALLDLGRQLQPAVPYST